MIHPRFEPQPSSTFRIIHSPLYYHCSALLKKISAGELDVKDAISRLKEAISKYPYQFEASYRLAELHTEAGDIEKACNARYKACQRIMQILPEDDEQMPLDWEYRENQYLLLLLYGSAIDHFLIGDYEMAAGLLETLLELDEEDHLDATKMLAYCYGGLKEKELFDLTLPDINDKDPEKPVVGLWGEYIFTGGLSAESVAGFKRDHPALYREFTAQEHPIDEKYTRDIDSENPSKEANARLIWLRTEHLWKENPGFTEALR